MEADISGHQRKVMRSAVRPLKAVHGTSGIPLRAGATLPFTVDRGWNAPAGHYRERWFLIDPETREVLLEGPERDLLVWGLQSVTDVTDSVMAPARLKSGRYEIVFALGGIMGATVEVEAHEVATEAAA